MTPLTFYSRRERVLKAITAAGLENVQFSSSDILDKLTFVFFPFLKLDSDLIKQSLIYYFGKDLTSKLLEEIVDRMLGGRDWIYENKCPLLKTLVPLAKPESCELQILSWRISKFNGVKSVIYRFRVMSGSCSGYEFERKVSLRFLPVFAKKLAFSKKNPWGKSPSELVRMWFSTTIDNDSRKKCLIFRDILVDSSLRSYNKKIALERKKPCVYKLPWTCVECPIGYDKCFRGTHPETYPKALCSNTSKGTRGINSLKIFHSGYFEPDYHGSECIKCRYLRALKRKKVKLG